jgi:tetratricopeptide (TPR) repeat protein
MSEKSGRGWRYSAEALAALVVVVAALAAVLVWQQRELSWLLRPEPEAPARSALGPRPPSSGPPPSPAPEPPAGPKALSVDGLEVEDRSGELAREPAVRRLVGRAEAELMGAVRDLKDRCGLYPTASDKVRVTLLPTGESLFQEAFQVSLAEGGARIDLPLEPLVLKWWMPREALAAGLAAALLIQQAPRYDQAPSWLRYGLALHLSGFGATVARREILLTERPPLQLVRPLSEAGEAAWVNGYWAVRAFASRKGEEAVQAWVEGLLAGQSWEEALGACGGESFQEFDGAHREWATAYLKEACANRQVYLDAVTLLRRQREADALPALAAFVSERPLDLYAGDARYYLNYARYRQGEYEAAIDGFNDLLNNDSPTTSRQGKARYFLGRSYQLAGYTPVAASEFRLAALEPENPLLVKLAQQRLKEIE